MNAWNYFATPISRCNGTKSSFLFLLLTLLSGLILSVLTALKVCNLLCSETAKYSVSGLDFGWFGSGFFCLMLFFLLLRSRIPVLGCFLFYSVCVAMGAEVRLIWIQKYEIGAWCPLCLSIAVAVAMAALVLFYESLVTRIKFGGSMNVKVVNFAIILVAIMIGFGGTLVGVQKEAGAAELDIFFGKRKSETTVYIISDWFCPVCRKIEPEIEKMFPELTTTARIAFVDMPIHPESANITPYHIQFMLYEKDKYISLRHSLDEISRTNKNPTQDQVQTVVSPLGVTLRPPNFMEILNGVRQFETIYRGFKVTATPTVVIDNTRTKKRKLLVGSNEITRNLIKAAIVEVEK
jgi:Thioredoxin